MKVEGAALAAIWVLCCAARLVGCGDDAPTSEVSSVDGGVVVDQGAVEVGVPLEDAAISPKDAATPDMDLRDSAPRPVSIVALRTVLGSPSTVSGLSNRVTCHGVDEMGAVVADVETQVEVRPAEGWHLDEAGRLVGAVATTYQVTCLARALGLRAAPARWDVLAGSVAYTHAVVSPEVVYAGEPASVGCEAFDAAGNAVSAEAASIALSPLGGGVNVVERRATVQTAGRYAVSCQVPGAEAVGIAALDVLPGPPAQLVATVAPQVQAHGVGDIVAFHARTTDIFGNATTGVNLTWASAPPLPSFGQGRFQAVEEGRYTLHVQVDGPTFEDRDLRVEAEILVDAGGPLIACLEPALGAMVVRDGALILVGRVSDVAGLRALTVDGRALEVGPDGIFSVEVQPGWGVNTHEVVAEDGVGHTNSTFCAYFAADVYLNEAAALPDAIIVDLSDEAVDDGPPNQPLASLTDLLRLILDSDTLAATLHESLLAQNPIVPNECRVDRVFGWCALEVGAEYRGLTLRGPHELSARLVAGGLRVRMVMRDLDLRVRLLGDFTNNGVINTEHVTMDLTFGLGLRGGQPDVWLQTTNELSVGAIDADFEGSISGTILDLVFDAFEDTIRDEVVVAMRDYLQGELNAMLEGVLSSFDLAALGASFSVPQPGAAPLVLSLGVAWSTLDATPARLRIGLSTVVNGPTGQAARSLGVPLPPGPAVPALEMERALVSGVALGMLNQVLHRLWRGGLFHFDDLSGAVGDLPEGTELALAVLAPPAVEGVGDMIDLHFGPAVGTFVLPGFFDEPVRLRLTAKARTAVTLRDGVALDFGGEEGLEIVDLRLAVEGVTMGPEARGALEALLQQALGRILDQALEGALPALPIPDFALPEMFDAYGIPPGTRLGLRDARLSISPTYMVIDGGFGE